MAKDMGKYNYQKKSQANAFTKEERDRIIEAFKTDDRKGTNYRHYAPFVEFLFRTGCRPSEAIGLRWEHVNLDRQLIHFKGSITQSGDGKQKWVDGSKTNSERDFPYTPALHTLLTSLAEKDGFVPRPDLPVFPSPRGKAISLDNFGKRAWNAVVDPIKPNTTVYSTRDTFITIQRQDGANLADIERWCDTSAEMIRKHYADADKLVDIRPTD
jgi:integrase